MSWKVEGIGLEVGVVSKVRIADLVRQVVDLRAWFRFQSLDSETRFHLKLKLLEECSFRSIYGVD